MKWRQLLRVTMIGLICFLSGCIGVATNVFHKPEPLVSETYYLPMPHAVPSSNGALTFRFAMLHDVIHERYPKHGPAYYRERERLALKKLELLGAEDPKRLPLLDDIAVGKDRLGHPEEGVAILRDKWELQKKLKLPETELYTTHANLGTLLIHAHFKKAIQQSQPDIEKVREGLKYVQESVRLNPNAHFGREEWQIHICQFILKAIEEKDRLLKSDFLDNPLRPGPHFGGSARKAKFDYLQNIRLNHLKEEAWESGRHHFTLDDLKDQHSYQNFISVRVMENREGTSVTPFDKPMLGIIGMWRQGGGPNPHFSLAIAETMSRVNQRRIAWAAYERTYRMADRFWPDPKIVESLKKHCREQQSQLRRAQGLFLELESEEELRKQFDAELAFGEKFQHDYQAFEEAAIARGASIEDDHFLDDFTKAHPIASPSGEEEYYLVYDEDSRELRKNYHMVCRFIIGVGIGLSLIAGCHFIVRGFQRFFNRPA